MRKSLSFVEGMVKMQKLQVKREPFLHKKEHGVVRKNDPGTGQHLERVKR